MISGHCGYNEETRMHVANAVLDCFAPGTRLEFDGPHVVVIWNAGGKEYRRRWMTRGQDFYPVWHHRWAHGGTACTALSQLVRWIKDKPVMPLATWDYWTSEKINLGRKLGTAIYGYLVNAEYPRVANCVLCHKPIEGGMDWWSLNGVSGPCCSFTSGCRQVKS